MSFSPVNSSSQAIDIPTPVQSHQSRNSTTVRPTMSSSAQSHQPTDCVANEISSKSITRDSFQGIAGQKPLPPLPEPTINDKRDSGMHMQDDLNGHCNVKSEAQGEDIEMEDAKSSRGASEEAGDEDGVDSKGKKKKGLRFYCSDYPPCNLSFTRSEHLARHIRKHTGERPFQCHCNRRFSRLDNLRQHAQTVHVNENIPMDSLAASGTRFQRQLRTNERPRPPSRSRSSTFTTGVTPPHMAHLHHRGHSRNLSSSSIGSMGSVSTMNGDDYRRAPLGFETPRSNRHSLDVYGSTSSPAPSHRQPYHIVEGNSPTGYSTPPSGNLSHGNVSPHLSSGFHSPANTSRGVYRSGLKPSHRRTQSSTAALHSHSPVQQSSAQMSPAPSNASLQHYSHYATSPVPSVLDFPSETPDTPVESDYRRHTWAPHINTQLRRPRAEPNVLTANHISDLPRPVFPSMEQQSSIPRLPGIHTFDQPPPPSSLLGARPPSPMQIDQPPTSHPAELAPKIPLAQHPNRGSWTSVIQRDMNRLDITNEHTSRPTSWTAAQQPAAVAEQPSVHAPIKGHSRHVSEPSPIGASKPVESTTTTPTARKNKRMGWYITPPNMQQVPSNTERPSPDSSDGAPTPVTASAGFQPAIIHLNGQMEPQGLAIQVEEPQKTNGGQFQTVRQSLPARPKEDLTNRFGLQNLHENAPAEHFHQAPPHKSHSSHQTYQAGHQTHQTGRHVQHPPQYLMQPQYTDSHNLQRIGHQAQHQQHHMQHFQHAQHPQQSPQHALRPIPQHSQQAPQHLQRSSDRPRSQVTYPGSQPHQPGQHAHQSIQQVHQLSQHAHHRTENKQPSEPHRLADAPKDATKRFDALVAVATTEKQHA